jgi:hypothetical protein
MATNGSIARYKNDITHQTRSMRGTSSSITRGGLVITADAATFELLRTAANIYYENLPENTKY